MNKNHGLALRDALRTFCARKDWTNPQAVTLTLRQGRQLSLNWVRLTRDAAQQNLRHFLNVIHKRLRPHGLPKRAVLQCLPVFEGNKTVRPHIHLMLDRPDGIPPAEYAAMIEREWQRTRWGHRLVTVEPCYDDDGWLSYISKLRTKDDFADAIDWTNFS